MSQGKLWEQQWSGHALWSPGTNRSSRVGLLLKPRGAIEINDHRIDSDGIVLCNKLRNGDSVFQIINVYTPNNHSDREAFFGNIWGYAFRNIDTVLVGDFNCIPDTKLDTWGGDDSFGDHGVSQLNTFANAFDLEDVFHVKNLTARA